MSQPTDRRGFLNKALLGAAGAGAIHGLEERLLLTKLSGEAGAAEVQQEQTDDEPMPCGKIGDLKISRLIMGGNLIGGWAHARDLIYVSKLFQQYNTEEKVFDTLALGERRGINTIQIDPAYLDVVVKYNKQRNGKMQTIVCISPDTDEGRVRDQIQTVAGKGASTIYTHGEGGDRFTRLGKMEILARALELIKDEGLSAGIGSHSLETPIACEKDKLDVDYYVKTFHDDRYWSATPEESREEWCWGGGSQPEHNQYHDNMFCLNSEKTAQFMATVEKPWIGFKILAAGAIHPRRGFAYALRNGVDFLCVGMFDFQVDDNAKLAKNLVRRIKDRRRPWRA